MRIAADQTYLYLNVTITFLNHTIHQLSSQNKTVKNSISLSADFD